MKVNSAFECLRGDSNCSVAFDHVKPVQAGKHVLYTVLPRMRANNRRAASGAEDQFKGWW